MEHILPQCFGHSPVALIGVHNSGENILFAANDLYGSPVSVLIKSAPLPELMDRKKRDIMERKGDKEDENKRQKQQKESSAAAL